MRDEPNYINAIGEHIDDAKAAHAALTPEDSEKVGYLQIFIRPNPEGNGKGKAMVHLSGDMGLVEMGLTALAANSDDFKNVLISTLVNL